MRLNIIVLVIHVFLIFVCVFICVDGLGVFDYPNKSTIYANYKRYDFDNSLPIRVGAVVALELNTNIGVLYFFVNDKQLPCCVINVPNGVCFAVCLVLLFIYLFVCLFVLFYFIYLFYFILFIDFLIVGWG
jgi:hypothetical protein